MERPQKRTAAASNEHAIKAIHGGKVAPSSRSSSALAYLITGDSLDDRRQRGASQVLGDVKCTVLASDQEILQLHVRLLVSSNKAM